MKRILRILFIMIMLFPSIAYSSEWELEGEIILPEQSAIEEDDSLTLREALQDSWETFRDTRQISFKDSLVKYPKFIKFCLNIYKWFDKNLNTYDPEYVGPTGKNGKVRLVSDNWVDFNSFRFKNISTLGLGSNLYCNLGIQANYSVLSVGYSVDLNSAFTGKKSHRKKTRFGISMARAYLEAYYWRNTGSTNITHFGNMSMGQLRDLKFEGLNSKSFGFSGFYIFNFRKFSYAAAYNLSNYQLKSAGSWIAGVTGTFYDCTLDFTQLPPSIGSQTHFPFDSYRADYNALSITGGYSFNWVLGKHWLFNTTTLPGLGLAISFSDSTHGRRGDLSMSLRQLNSLTYTHRQFFVTALSNFDINLLVTHTIAFSSGQETFQVSTGVRF